MRKIPSNYVFGSRQGFVSVRLIVTTVVEIARESIVENGARTATVTMGRGVGSTWSEEGTVRQDRRNAMVGKYLIQFELFCMC